MIAQPSVCTSVVMAVCGWGHSTPLCQCGEILTDVRSADEQTRWAERWDLLEVIGRTGERDGLLVLLSGLSSEGMAA